MALIWIDKGDILIVQDVSMRRDGKMFALVIKFYLVLLSSVFLGGVFGSKRFPLE